VRPVILATFSVRIDPGAERMAFENALDVGARRRRVQAH